MFPRWMKWLFLAFLAYLIYAGTHPAPVTTPSGLVALQSPAINNTTYPAIAQALDGERWKRALNPDYAKHALCGAETIPATGLGWRMIEDVVGAGDKADCQDTITIHLTIWNAAGNASYDGELPITLGERSFGVGIDAGLVGIAPGGVRTLVLSPAALTRAAKSKAPRAALNALPTTRTAIVTVKRID